MDKLIEDIECEIERLEILCNQNINDYMSGQMDAYQQVLTRLKGI